MTEEGHHISDEQRRIANENLIEAVRNDDRATIELCLKKGADINTRWPGYRDRTPLMIAVMYSRAEQTSYLIDRGADLFLKDGQGSTVFDIVKGLDDNSIRKKINTKLLAALPDADGPAEQGAEQADGGSPPAEAPSGSVETQKDIAVLKPIEINRRKKGNGGLQL